MLGELVAKFRGRPQREPLPAAAITVEPPKPTGPKPELINPSTHPLGKNIEFVLYAGRWNRHAKSTDRLVLQQQVEDSERLLEEKQAVSSGGETFMLGRVVRMREIERGKYSRESAEFKNARRKLRTARGQLDRAIEKKQKALNPFEQAVSSARYSLEDFDEQFALNLPTLQGLAFFIVDRMPQDPIGRESLIARFVTKPGFRFDPAQLVHVNSLIFDLERKYPDRDIIWMFGGELERKKDQNVKTNSLRQSEIVKKLVRSKLVGVLMERSRNP